MHDRHTIVERRLDRVLRERIRPARYGPVEPLTITAYEIPGEPISFEDVMLAMVDGLFRPFTVGSPYGRPWGTTWFHVAGTVPESWKGAQVEARIDLGFGLAPGFQAEGLVWGPNGPLRALNPLNHAIPLLMAARGGEEFEVLVEAASNPNIGGPGFEPTPLGDPATLPETPLYALKRAELAVFHPEVAALVHDLDVLGGLMRNLPLDGPRRPQITRAVERALDALDLVDVASTAATARAELAGVLSKPAVASAHRVSAIGHAHIDTAWLWPLRETIRKCARTFSNVLDLMTREPELRFVCSQAQQHEWMRDHYPTIFATMQQAVADGRFLPAGGMWVEADTNLPSGESLARQFLHGQRFFDEHYGVTCEEVWIPDVFGYPASLPQIFRLGGARWFLTQKLSWNKQNRMPHHTFHWQGIDGTTIFTHFPPVDTYNASIQPAELIHAERNYADHGGGSMSVAPFGYGDGGGGPTREMMERFRRVRNLEGLPRVDITRPAEWFPAALADYPDAPTWVGELYFEMHRGTYTSQARTKAGNRRTEVLLGDTELWSVLAAGLTDHTYPLDDLGEAWRETLTLQFHDIIPGSSIAWVHDEAEATYARLAHTLGELRDSALAALAAPAGGQVLLANAAPATRAEVVVTSAALGADGQRLSSGDVACWIEVAPLSAAGWDGHGALPQTIPPVQIHTPAGDIVLDNGLVRVTIDRDGLVSSFMDLRAGREIVKPGHRANVLELSADHPIEYDAWDLDEYYQAATQSLTSVEAIDVIDSGPLLARVQVRRAFGRSAITQDIVLRAGSARLDFGTDVTWHEDEKVLKVAWPVDILADTACCDIQFGHVRRPTHASTSWDAAKFEICAHRWIDVSEPSFGVALLNDCKYGHDIQRGALRLTLLRAANFPDPDADRGEHSFTYAVFPHRGGPTEGDVIAEAARLNQPVLVQPGGGGHPATITAVEVDHRGVVVTAVKHAEDGSGDLVVRCYEAAGDHVRTTLRTLMTPTQVTVCDFLERPLAGAAGAATLEPSGEISIRMRPFQILTMRVR